MVLPLGTISLSQVNTELCDPSTTTISLNDSDVRTLAQVPTGVISMDDLRGKYRALNFTGGTEFTPGDGYKYHVFTSTGPLTGDCSEGIIEYLAVGGGGGGGGSVPGPFFGRNGEGGGGGAGGFLTGDFVVTGTFSTTVTIGAGGAGGAGSSPARGNPGSDTTVPAFSITAGYGGGGGAGTKVSPTAFRAGLSAPLGSGGGSGYAGSSVPGSGPQGNPGATGNPASGAGGGGSGSKGSSGANGGGGGSGTSTPSDWTPIPSVRPGYSGGGGGANSGGASSTWGGGSGGNPGGSGTTNSGGGGGGSGTSGQTGGNGGSGFFVLRYSASPGSAGISGGTEFTPGDGYKYCILRVLENFL